MSDIEIKVPVLGESIVEATVSKWIKQKGDHVKQDDLLLELETDKITLEILAPQDGILVDVLCAEGALVKIGQTLAILLAGSKTQTMAAEHSSIDREEIKKNLSSLNEKKVVEEDINTIKQLKDGQDLTESSVIDFTTKKSLFDLASPAARKRIIDGHVRNVHSTRLDGRITKIDVNEEVVNQEKDMSDTSQADSIAKKDQVLDEVIANKEINVQTQEVERQESRTPMSRLRQKISERLKYAQNTAAILTTFNEIDMSQVFALRSLYKDTFEKKYQTKLGFMSFFVKACVKALQELPIINSRIEGEEIVSSNYVDISVAISAPQGLVVPVLRDADLLEMWEIEKKIYEFGQKAKNNKLSLEEMSGGTFSISNGGVFGSLLSTPIINPPQSAILGMHKIQERPVVIDGKIEIRPMMYVALSYDHRLIDGREAVTFLVTLKKILENPGYFILGL